MFDKTQNRPALAPAFGMRIRTHLVGSAIAYVVADARGTDVVPGAPVWRPSTT